RLLGPAPALRRRRARRLRRGPRRPAAQDRALLHGGANADLAAGARGRDVALTLWRSAALAPCRSRCRPFALRLCAARTASSRRREWAVGGARAAPLARWR